MNNHPLNISKGDIERRHELLWENDSVNEDVSNKYILIGNSDTYDYELLYVMYHEADPSDTPHSSIAILTLKCGVDKATEHDVSIPSVGDFPLMWPTNPQRINSVYGTPYYRNITLIRCYEGASLFTYCWRYLKISPLYNAYGAEVDESTSEQKHLVPYRIYGIR